MSKKKYPPYNTYSGLVDSHTHLLHMKEKGIDLQELFTRLREDSFSWILDAGVDEKAFEDRLAFMDDYPHLLFSCGIHPEAVEGDPKSRLDKIRDQARHDKVVAIGEIGLDYYWKERSPDLQKTFFTGQLQLAAEEELPVIIHNREADKDCLDILRSYDLPRAGVMHCYSSDREFARKVLDLGFYLSFAGNVTYKNARNIQNAAAFVPSDRILVETDAPYLSPQERRGRLNHPGQLGYTVDFLCQLRGETPEDLVRKTAENFQDLFIC